MKLEEYLKNYEKEILLELNLNDIEAYTMASLAYLKSPNKEQYDLEEIITCLSYVPDLITEITSIVYEIIDEKIK